MTDTDAVQHYWMARVTDGGGATVYNGFLLDAGPMQAFVQIAQRWPQWARWATIDGKTAREWLLLLPAEQRQKAAAKWREAGIPVEPL